MDREKLLLDRERLELDKKKFAFEQRFLNRYLTAIATLVISLATGVLSWTQFRISATNQARESARLQDQHERDSKMEKERQNAEWRIKAGDFVAVHADQVFSNDPNVHRRMVGLIRASFPDGVREDVLTVVENIVNPAQKSTYRLARTVDSSAAQLTGLSQSQQAFSRMDLSRLLQAAIRDQVSDTFLGTPASLAFNEPTAVLLVWSSMPVSTSIYFDGDVSRIQFNTDKSVFWNWPDPGERRAFANDSHTISTLTGKLAVIKGRLLEAGNSNAAFFAPSNADKFVGLALDTAGDVILSSLLYFESQVIGAAGDVGVKIAGFEASGKKNEISNSLQSLSDQIEKLQNARINSIFAGRVDIRQLVLEKTTEEFEVSAKKPKGVH